MITVPSSTLTVTNYVLPVEWVFVLQSFLWLNRKNKTKNRLSVLSLCQVWSCAGLSFGTWPGAFWLFQPASDISLRWFRKLLETTWGWTVNTFAEHTHQWSMSLLFHFSAERQAMGQRLRFLREPFLRLRQISDIYTGASSVFQVSINERWCFCLTVGFGNPVNVCLWRI